MEELPKEYDFKATENKWKKNGKKKIFIDFL